MKYLITQEQLEYLTSVNSHIADDLLASLKPIEPLSDKEITRLWSDAHNDTTDRMAHQVLARAVEARILGEST